MDVNKDSLTCEQLDTIARYGWDVADVLDNGIAVCELHHPNGVADLYIELDGGICIEEGDDLDGFDLVPVEDSSLAGLFQ